MKFYNFLLLTNLKKSKKWLMRDKERIENGEIRVIKWERIWNNDREDKKERDREKAMNDTYCNFELSR